MTSPRAASHCPSFITDQLDEIRRQAREATERSATAQGLPARIVDRQPLRQIAVLLRGEVQDRAA